MRFTLKWLKEYLDTDANVKDIANMLTSIGLEVEEVIDPTLTLKSFKIVEIISTTKHKEADKLQICMVNTGNEILQIVCGARNARAGLKTIYAQVGTIIPTNNMKIKKSNIRGVESNGMLCSAAELGINYNDEQEGIIELPEDSIVGDDIFNALSINDQIIEVSITPNRGDCLSVYGIARDLAATGIGRLKALNVPMIEATYTSPKKFIIESDCCKRVLGRYIRNVKNCQSPKWLQEYLKNVGMNSISALVDISNYVSHCYGRPSHIFDASKINGDLIYREAIKGEKFLSLKDIEYKFNGGEKIIADNDRVISIAAIMGGKSTACQNDTTDIFIEVALFDAVDVAKTGRKLKIESDARYRFERKIDPNFLEIGMEIITSLIIEICGGEPSEVIAAGKNNFKSCIIEFDYSLIKKLGGIEIDDIKVDNILTALGFKLEKQDNYVKVIVPSWRQDISIKEDLVEEVLRIHGYDKIPITALEQNLNVSSSIVSQLERYTSKARRKLVACGYMELYTWSFMDSKIAQNFTSIVDNLKLINPISSQLNYMRPSIIPNLLSAIEYNKNRGFDSFSFFEIGPTFCENKDKKQEIMLAGIRAGIATPRNIHTDSRKFDVFESKSDLFDCITRCGININNVTLIQEAPSDIYHPARSCILKIGRNIIGYCGELHPSITRLFKIKDEVNAFELFLERVPVNKNKRGYKGATNFSEYPMVERDFAFIIKNDIQVGEIERAVLNVNKVLIRDVLVFDIYSGHKIQDNYCSIALNVHIQSDNKTLNNEEIEELSQDIIKTITSKFNCVLRDRDPYKHL